MGIGLPSKEPKLTLSVAPGTGPNTDPVGPSIHFARSTKGLGDLISSVTPLELFIISLDDKVAPIKA